MTLPAGIRAGSSDERPSVTDLQAEASAVRAELVRIDGKAGLLLPWAGGAFAVIATLTTAATSTAYLPGPALVGLWGVAALLAGAVLLLLLAVRPLVLRTSFLAPARAITAHDLLHRLTTRTLNRPEVATADMGLLARLVLTKDQRLRLAVDLLVAALLLLAIVLPFTHS